MARPVAAERDASPSPQLLRRSIAANGVFGVCFRSSRITDSTVSAAGSSAPAGTVASAEEPQP
ncbi:hypothetical protein GCM10010306_098730 [Streptomyces umbrinus]|uniref:hypothetical protein n=1 Tax=Streptomyces umbrinus TaxID=67370 RepID=UPI0016737071|nr:hypothetical protein [Streptomyces umbrinus]GHB87918.1 hypothetical protein GCM10010306_098730 [Streptomyces umbrinus]